MNEEQAALVHYRLGEAKETLEEARLLAREFRWRGALNRVYYAMFYATLALLEELIGTAESFITEAERLSQQLLTQQNE